MLSFALLAVGLDNDSDRAFLEQIYKSHRAIMYYQAFVLLKHNQDAEDVLIECWLQLCKHIEKLRELNGRSPIDMRRYLLRSVKNTAINHLTKKGRLREAYMETYDEYVNSQESPDEPVDFLLEQSDHVDEIKAMLRQLPEIHYNILQMKYTDEMSDKEIGACLGIKPESVRAYVSSARRVAREVLGSRRGKKNE